MLNKKIIITKDDCPTSPREEFCLGKITAASKKYSFTDDCGIDIIDVYDFHEMIENESKEIKKYIYLPLYKYEHGGIILKAGEGNPFSCPWDSGQIGYIYIEKEEAKEHLGLEKIKATDEQRIKEILKSEIDVFSQYCNGEVYSIIVTYLTEKDYLKNIEYNGKTDNVRNIIKEYDKKWTEEERIDFIAEYLTEEVYNLDDLNFANNLEVVDELCGIYDIDNEYFKDTLREVEI